MSTRSNIIVEFEGKRELFYHHFDGYLEGVGFDLLIRGELASRNISFFDEDKQGKMYRRFKELLQEEEHYEPVDLPSEDIEFLYYVIFDPDKPSEISISYSAVDLYDCDDDDINELMTAKHGDYEISLKIVQKKIKD